MTPQMAKPSPLDEPVRLVIVMLLCVTSLWGGTMSVAVSCDGMVDPTNASDKSNVESTVVEGRTL